MRGAPNRTTCTRSRFANYEATARSRRLARQSAAETDRRHHRASRDPTIGDCSAPARCGRSTASRQGETTKQDVATDLVNKVANLRVIGAADAPRRGRREPVLLLTARTANGEFDYRFFQPQPKSDLIVTRNGQDGAFKVAAYVGEPLIKDSDDLTVAATAAATPRRRRSAKPRAEVRAATPALRTPAAKPSALLLRASLEGAHFLAADDRGAGPSRAMDGASEPTWMTAFTACPAPRSVRRAHSVQTWFRPASLARYSARSACVRMWSRP